MHSLVKDLRKTPAKIDLPLFIVSGMFIGMGGGMLFAAFSAHDVGMLPAAAIFVAYVALVVAVACLAMRWILKRRKSRIARLHAEGLLPDLAELTDADVIRLANRELREDAAIVYQEIHGGALDTACFIVGYDRMGRVLVCVLLFVFLALLASNLYQAIAGNHHFNLFNSGAITAVFTVNFFVFIARNKRLRENREKIANGILPASDMAILKRSGNIR